MRYSSFPAGSRKVSRLGFGAMGLGGAFGNHDQPESKLIQSVLHALDLGVDFIDTARGYGNSEAIIGKALQQWRGAPPFIATKVESLGKDNTRWAIPPSLSDTFPRGHITSNADTSLRTLGVERLDLLQLHVYWPNWGTDGYFMDELLALKSAGKVAAIGVSAPDHRADVVLPLVLSGLIDSVQVVYNIFDPLAADCLIPACRDKQVAVIARCIMDEGGLTGTISEETQFEDADFRKSFFASVPRSMYVERVNRLRQFVPEHARTLASLAIRFALHDPAVTTAITSMHVPEQTDENVAALDEPPLSDGVYEQLRRRHRWVRNFFDSKYWT